MSFYWLNAILSCFELRKNQSLKIQNNILWRTQQNIEFHLAILLQYMDSVLSIYMLKVKNRCVFQNYLFGKVVTIDQFNPIMSSIHKMVNRTLKLLQHNFVETILNTFNVCLTFFFLNTSHSRFKIFMGVSETFLYRCFYKKVFWKYWCPNTPILPVCSSHTGTNKLHKTHNWPLN